MCLGGDWKINNDFFIGLGIGLVIVCIAINLGLYLDSVFYGGMKIDYLYVSIKEVTFISMGFLVANIMYLGVNNRK